MVTEMSKAAGSRCCFGLREDPFQTRLEQLASHILDKEDALFFPTATMCNQTAIQIFCSPGDKFIAEAESHCILSEAGAPAALSGVMVKSVTGDRGFPDPEDLEEAIEPSDELRSRISLIVVENTHNRAGGAVLTPEQMGQIQRVAERHGIPVHLDGARIFNAAVALGLPASDFTRYAQSVSVSLNKGLSAPMGAVLAGSKDFIKEAVRVRQRFGGGWRPTGLLAAAGIVALETMIDRLAEDHKNARKMAEGLVGLRGLGVDLSSVQTNMVVLKVNHPTLDTRQVIEALEKSGIRALKFGRDSIRLVLHREIGEFEVDTVIETFRSIL